MDKKIKDEDTNDYGTLQGFRDLMKKVHPEQMPEPSTGTVHNMADGGVPPLDDTMTSLNQTPPTNYDFYKDIDSNQRNALYQQLLQKQHTGAGNVIASGLGGLGDAISNSFGGQHNTYQKDIMGNAAANTQANIGAVDTRRQQRMQDMQGSQEMQMNDPNGPLAVGMREMLKSQNINVPSGMNASLMLKAMGPLGEMAMKQATLQLQASHNKADEDIARQGIDVRKDELKRQGAKDATDAADKSSEAERQAAVALDHRGLLQKGADFFSPSDSTKVLQGQLKGGASKAPHGHTVVQNGHTYTWNGSKYE